MAKRDGLRGFIGGMNKSGEIQTRDLSKRKNSSTPKNASVRNTRDQSIRGYLSKLERAGEIIRIEKEVDPQENMGAIQWRVYDEHSKASRFKNIKGYPLWEACSQIFTDRNKWALGVNLTPDEILGAMSKKLY